MHKQHTDMVFSRGLTLIELIVAIAIVGMVTGGIVAFERSILMNTKVVQSEFISQGQIRKALTSFVKELRTAAPSANGSFTIDTAGTSTLIFYSNSDTDVSVERVRYFLATTTLRKGITKPTGTVYNLANEKISSIVNDITNATGTPIFTYYDTGYDGFTSSSTDPLPSPVNLPAVRMVKISLKVNPNGVRAPVAQTYTTQVMIRNLKDNL